MSMNSDRMKVYKYRGSTNNFKRDLESLVRNYFYAPNAEKLNDPCETLVFTDKFSLQMDFAFKIFNVKSKSSIEDLDNRLEDFIKMKKDFGIYSLSKVFDHELLWAHYASNHEGFCIEYDFQILKNSKSKYL